MEKKGFTLVELLGVMTVLGIIALLIIPAVEKTISNSKKKGLENQKNTIISGAKSWMTDNKELVEDDEVIVTVGDLKQEGYLEFIESFNHIHKYLKKYTDSDDNVSFSDLLYKAKAHPMIHLYLDELQILFHHLV